MPRGAEKFIKDVVKEAGDAVLKRFGKDGIHYLKSVHRMDAVTKADLLSERLILARIKKAYPSHGIISEERGRANDSAEYVWIVDPIDGTLNFASGIPLFGIMVCLARSGKVILSAVFMPATRELFFAKEGAGAFLNGKRIRASKVTNFGDSAGCGSTSIHLRYARFLSRLIPAAKGQHVMITSTGSICGNACYVAMGRRDWIVALIGQIHDYAPVSLILKEAGCTVTDTAGKPWRLGTEGFVAANPKLHRQVLKLARGI